MKTDIYNLARFLDAQSAVFEQACAELRSGRKTGHWMWFVFPQIVGLGSSSMSRFYALSSLEEAGAYREHPVLGARLEQATSLVGRWRSKSVHEIFGSPDDLKFSSCMTLFSQVSAERSVFASLIESHLQGRLDPQTMAILRARDG